MMKIKLKPFLKYKEYRQYIIKKCLRKIVIPIILILAFFSSMIISMNILAKDNIIKQLGNNLGQGTIKQDNKTETKTDVKIQNPVQPAQVKPEVKAPAKVSDKSDYQNSENKLKELQIENEKLKEDNLYLQNSLKMAASRGARPKNYRMAPQITSRSGVLEGRSLGYFNITAYTPTKAECGSDRGITASGHPIMPGVTVAVDKRFWPIGTVFYIKGLGYVVAMDTGGAIKGRNRMDFAVLDTEFAKQIGRKKFEVYLISMGNGKVGDIEF